MKKYFYSREQAIKVIIKADEILPPRSDNVVLDQLVTRDQKVTGIIELIPDKICRGVPVGR